MIDGYNKERRSKEALYVFNQMQREETELKKFVLSSALSACAKLGALDQGIWIHSYIRKKFNSPGCSFRYFFGGYVCKLWASRLGMGRF